MSVPELLAKSPIFRKVGPDDRARLAAISRLKTYPRGETIVSEGAPPDFFFFITTGRVKVFKATPAGREVLLEVFGPGDPFGAVAVIEKRPFPASVMALEDTTCLMIPQSELFALLESSPSLVRGLFLGLIHRLIELTNRLAELTGGRVEPRMARLFLKFATEIGRAERGGTFIPLPLSRQDLADMTGTTIETSIRIMSRWAKDRIVQTEKDGFVVLDRNALEAVAAGS